MDELISKDRLRQEALKIGGHFYSDWDTSGVLTLIERQPKVEAKTIVMIFIALGQKIKRGRK